MDAKSVLACIAFVAAFFCAFAGVWWMLAHVERIRRQSKVQAAVGGNAAYLKRVLANGYPQLRAISDVMLEWTVMANWADQVCWWLGEKGFDAKPCCLLELCLAAGGSGGLATWVFLGSALPGVACAVSTFAILVVLASRLRTQRREGMREEVPDVLHAMSACFKAGFSLQQTFHHLAKEVRGPLRDCFSRAASSLDLGYPTETVLDTLRRDADVPEMAFVCVALEVQHQAGGSMQHILNSAKETVATELSLHRSLRVQTAQAKLSAQIVTVMPFVLVALISMMSQDFLAPFFSSFTGVMMLLVALGMQVAGIAMARRMLHVVDL